jgi:hypothetical protein
MSKQQLVSLTPLAQWWITRPTIARSRVQIQPRKNKSYTFGNISILFRNDKYIIRLISNVCRQIG